MNISRIGTDTYNQRYARFQPDRVVPTELRVTVHEKTKRITIKIINPESREVIREIPPEKELDRLAKMWEHLGLLVDKKI